MTETKIFLLVCDGHDDFVWFLSPKNPTDVYSLCLLLSSRGKANYINLGSFLIKPVQRVMRYPLLLTELLGATPESHHDRPQLTKAVQAVKDINVNINEYKRRKDLGKKKEKLHLFRKVSQEYFSFNLSPVSANLIYLCLVSSSNLPPSIPSGEVQEGGRRVVHRQDLQAEHALHHQKIEPGQQPHQAPDRDLTSGLFLLHTKIGFYLKRGGKLQR